jgi:hypothetical protein
VRSSLLMSHQVCQTAYTDANTMPDSREVACENALVHKTVRRMLGIGLLAAIAYAVWRKFPSNSESAPTWEPQPFPFPPQPAVRADGDSSPWIEPADSGACPAHHPVKAKSTSGIFHVPGGANYTRTVADRCYLSPEAAESDGFRQSKN